VPLPLPLQLPQLLPLLRVLQLTLPLLPPHLSCACVSPCALCLAAGLAPRPQLLLQLLPALPALSLAQQQQLLVPLLLLVVLLLLLLLVPLVLLLVVLLAAAVRPSCHCSETHYRHNSKQDSWFAW
jgi:hypothetical protein